MNLLTKLWIKHTSRKVGVDEFGNAYYLGYRTNYLGHRKRYVIFKGADQTTKVPPMWHAWLHYLANEEETPQESQNKGFKWQKKHHPNLSGSKYAYDPKKSNNRILTSFSAWQPKR